MIQMNDVGESNGELALWIEGKRVSHLGKGYPKGKWTFDKFLVDQGGESVRWNDEKRGPENFSVPAGGSPFDGFRWRSDERLKLNFLWVLFYITRSPQGKISKVWFDDIVVAKEYIGPLAAKQAETKNTVRVAAAQPKSRLIDYRVRAPAEALAKVDQSIEELSALIDRAGEAGCDVVALPEDTLGLGHWEAGNPSTLKEVLQPAVERMLDRLGATAARNHINLVCSNDAIDDAGMIRNSAFLVGRDGKLIGRYDKVNMPIHELFKERGRGFPVFHTPDLGDVGMLICYDMVFPEAARCLALGGADIIFHPTLGGAAIGDGDVSTAAFRTRAVENFVYIVVSQRGSGSMIIAPTGKILVEAKGPDSLAIADIDLHGAREGGDAMNHQRDMRARLFRERSPAAFGILTDPNPPVLKKAPETISIADAVRVANGTLTVGSDEFKSADALLREGKLDDAASAFKTLINKYPATWIDRVSRERLERIEKARSASAK
jgi:predicted amidohydrolase